jgi:hypothetical protein
MSRLPRLPAAVRWTVPALLLVATGVSLGRAASSPQQHDLLFKPAIGPVVKVERTTPLRVLPLYNEPGLVSDAELGAVLAQVRPRFDRARLRANYVEHALRAWGIDAEFGDPEVMSGAAMKDFLVDHGKFLASWGPDIRPLLVDEPQGVGIRWGTEECASVHHDHWLACLTEAGTPLDEPIFTPSRKLRTFNDALQQGLRDFRLDERETEWSAMAFGLWIAPVKSWQTGDGRTLSFDLLAQRLIRGHKRFGVCSGTHRLYSLMLLYRLDDDHGILSPAVKSDIRNHLLGVRQNIIDSQFEDGHWPSNWMEGKVAVDKPLADELHRKVIATGHHLEWLAIAPVEFHPPRESLKRAFRWMIDTTVGLPVDSILSQYTFFSHVGNALSLWRMTRPADYWKTWEAAHPEVNVNQPKAGATSAATQAAKPAEH